MKSKEELFGIWYNDYFKLIIENGRIYLNTNIETVHKPFYTKQIVNEPLKWEDNGTNIKISENLSLVKGNPSNVIVVFRETDQGLEPMRLIKFEL